MNVIWDPEGDVDVSETLDMWEAGVTSLFNDTYPIMLFAIVFAIAMIWIEIGHKPISKPGFYMRLARQLSGHYASMAALLLWIIDRFFHS